MKNKTLLSLIFLAFTLQISFAQNSKIKYTYLEVSARIGLIPTFVKDVSRAEIPAVGIDVDYRINRKFSVGLFGGYTKVMSHPNMLGDGKPMTFLNQFTMTGVKFAVHSTNLKKWDFYGGMSLAYAHSLIDVMEGDIEKLKKHKNFIESSGKMVYSAFVGAKFLVNTNLSFFGEVGYGISLLTVGVSKKF